MNALAGSGKWFDDVRIGDAFSSALTITETHIVLGAGLIGDFNPHHVNAEYAKASRFGTPILHGMLTSSIMGAAVGMYFHGSAIAYLEHRARWETLAMRGWDNAGGVEARSVYGNILVALGENGDLGGENNSRLHIDISLRGGRLELDDEPIVEDGRFLAAELG